MTESAPPSAASAPPNTADLTPAMRQYQAVKARHPDCIVFFRIGDFYEIFYDDAKTAARVLGIALTARSKTENAVPMAGVPYHAVDGYLARMLEAGYRVAVCEQLEDPKAVKGVVRRDVVRIITPGTLTDETLLTETRPNYLAAVIRDGKIQQAGLAWVELSTGAFAAADVPIKNLHEELARLSPAECLVPESQRGATLAAEPTPELLPTADAAPGDRESPDSAGPQPEYLTTLRPDWVFGPRQAEAALCQQFGVKELTGFGWDRVTPALQAAGAIVEYLSETQRTQIRHLRPPVPAFRDRVVGIDATTLRSLEIVTTIREGRAAGSLLSAVDRTRTSMGARRLRAWMLYPPAELAPIRARQDAVAALLADARLRQRLREQLGEVGDIERIIARISCNRASPRDLLGLARSLAALAPLAAQLTDSREPTLAELAGRMVVGRWSLVVGRQDSTDTIASPNSSQPAATNQEPTTNAKQPTTNAKQPTTNNQQPTTNDQQPTTNDQQPTTNDQQPTTNDQQPTTNNQQPSLVQLIGSAIREDASAKVADGGVIRDGFDAELDRLRAITHDGQRWLAEYQAAQIKATGIASLKVGFNSVFGYFIEITNTHKNKVPSSYVRKQTVRNAERYITEELKRHESESLTAEERAKALEVQLFEQVRARVAEHTAEVQSAADAAATLDVLTGFAEYAAQRRCVRPELVAASVLEIADGRHPVLDLTLDSKFVPNDVRLDEACRLGLITGPNMAGKSTFIRQTAVLALLAHTGSFVPATRARVGLVDRIFARVGAADDLARGRSTFMVEMTETANILNNAGPASLVILDEIGRGTSTYDGLSLAWAITEHIVGRIGCRTLFATHYHELTELAAALPGLANFSVAVQEWGDGIVFLHRIVPGGADRSYGLHVAKLAGVPREVIARAEAVLTELEGRSAGARTESSTEPAARPTRPTATAVKRAAGSALALHQREQLLLFEDLPHPVLTELRSVSPASLSDAQLRELLVRLCQQVQAGG